MNSSWLIIGISGVSCSGKTTLTNSIFQYFTDKLKNIEISQIKIIRQDDYFYSINSPNHIWIPELNHINREHLNALNMELMLEDINSLLQKTTTSVSTSVVAAAEAVVAATDAVVATVSLPQLSTLSSSQAIPQAQLTPPPKQHQSQQRINILIIEGHLVFVHPKVNDLFDKRFLMRITYEECRKRRNKRVYPQPTPPGYFDQYVWPTYENRLAKILQLPNLYQLNGNDNIDIILKNVLDILFCEN